jgi:two-component system OmpR family sensor kinase
MKRKWLVVLAPAVVSAIAALIASRILDLPPGLKFEASIPFVILAIGLILSALLAIVLVAQAQFERVRAVARAEAQAQATDEKRQAVIEAQARDADDKRRLFRRLDHELKNPLTALDASIENLAEASTEADRLKARESSELALEQLRQLVRNLRKVSDIASQVIERQPVAVATLLENVVCEIKEQRPEAKDRRFVGPIVQQAPVPVSAVLGDYDLLFLAIMNVVDNAVKYTHSGDTIEVRAAREGGFVVISVADTGRGIPEEDLPYVWQELHRGQNVGAVPGSGVGLALVRIIVEKHGGQYELKSPAGMGTEVTLRLPAA